MKKFISSNAKATRLTKAHLTWHAIYALQGAAYTACLESFEVMNAHRNRLDISGGADYMVWRT